MYCDGVTLGASLVKVRRSLTLVLGLLLAFAVLVLLAGALNSGYLHSRDYVSSLASRGADQAWVGVLALASFAAAHAVAAMRWRRTARIVWATLLACSALVLVVALARASCPEGAGRCSLPGRASVTDLGDTIHGLSVGVYLLAFVLAAICAGVVLLRRRRRGPGAVILVLAALSILTASQIDERTPGAEQRLWLAVNALGLVALAGFAGSTDTRKQVTPE